MLTGWMILDNENESQPAEVLNPNPSRILTRTLPFTLTLIVPLASIWRDRVLVLALALNPDLAKAYHAHPTLTGPHEGLPRPPSRIRRSMVS